VAQVEDMRAHDAPCERAVANLLEVSSLPEVHDDHDHLGAMTLLQPGNGHRAADATRIRQHDARRAHRRPYFSSRLSSAAAFRSLRATMRIVSSPAIVPTASASCARSIAAASGWAWPAGVRTTTSCRTRTTVRRNSEAACSRAVSAWAGAD